MNQPKHGKLVRDHIPSIIFARTGDPADVVRAAPEQMLDLLRAKLLEEAFEAASARPPEDLCEELADVLEVVTTLGGFAGGMEAVWRCREKKLAERGGFSEGYILYSPPTDEPDLGAEPARVGEMTDRVRLAELRAEALEKLTKGAFCEVALREEELARVLDSRTAGGEIARVTAVSAWLRCKEAHYALELAEQYLAEAMSDNCQKMLRELKEYAEFVSMMKERHDVG